MMWPNQQGPTNLIHVISKAINKRLNLSKVKNNTIQKLHDLLYKFHLLQLKKIF